MIPVAVPWRGPLHFVDVDVDADDMLPKHLDRMQDAPSLPAPWVDHHQIVLHEGGVASLSGRGSKVLPHLVLHCYSLHLFSRTSATICPDDYREHSLAVHLLTCFLLTIHWCGTTKAKPVSQVLQWRYSMVPSYLIVTQYMYLDFAWRSIDSVCVCLFHKSFVLSFHWSHTSLTSPAHDMLSQSTSTSFELIYLWLSPYRGSYHLALSLSYSLWRC